MSAPSEALAKRTTVFAHVPVGLFGSVMGLTGLSIAWRLAADRFGVGHALAEALGRVSVLVFVGLAGAYAVKVVAFPEAVRNELQHPSVGNLFGTIFISLLLLPAVLIGLSRPLAIAAWIVGAAGMFAFALAIVDRWLSRPQDKASVSPTWIVPVVGLLDVPVAAPALGLPSLDGTMGIALAIGIFFAVPLFTLIFTRLLFEPALPPGLQPTLLILIAPFAVGCSAYVATTGAADGFAQALLAVACFVLLVFGARLRNLRHCCPFRFAWWAVSFPLAATTIAALRVGGASSGWPMNAVSIALLGLSTFVVAALLWRTVRGMARGELQELAS